MYVMIKLYYNTFPEMKYSWGKNHSLLFIDNPVGTGFSFTDDDRGYATNQTTVRLLKKVQAKIKKN